LHRPDKGARGVARIRIAEARLDGECVGHLEIGLQVEPLRHGVAEVFGKLDLTDGRHHIFLDVVPLDVVDAAREPDAVVDVVLGPDLEAVHRVGLIGGRRLLDAEIFEVSRAADAGILERGVVRNRRVSAAGAEDVKISRLPNCSGSFHLLVQIGEEKRWPGLGSYQLSSWDKTHSYSLVKFDSGFVSNIGGSKTPIVDFRRFSRDPAAISAQLKRISVEEPQTVQAFAKASTLDPNAVFWSTYPSLIHELGHSFGLCDTYEAPMKDQCDPAYSTPEQPSSVMKDSTYFYLTTDDTTAIQRLFQRFR